MNLRTNIIILLLLYMTQDTSATPLKDLNLGVNDCHNIAERIRNETTVYVNKTHAEILNNLR